MSKVISTEELAAEPSVAVQAYDKVVAGAELRDIKLLGMNFKINPKFFSEDDDTVTRGLGSAFGSRFIATAYEPGEGYLAGQIEWSAVVKKGRTKLISIEATYFVIYDEAPEVEETHALAFLRKVGRFATYPYFRALVSRLASEAGLNLPILPVLK